ncbi:MAG: hypothetical protein AB7V44_32645, partial [Pseudonocardia sp.]
RATPGCNIILVDRSESMGMPWAGSAGLTLAEGAAIAINKTLFQLCVRSTKEAGQPLRPYFYIGIYGYGLCPSAGGEGVESALPGPLAQRAIVPLPELADSPIDVRPNPSTDAMPGRGRLPVWYEPAHGFRTPMCAAMHLAGSHATEWAKVFPKSFPPIFINITDGLVTDSPHRGLDLAGWAARLTSIETGNGRALLLNAFLSASQAPITAFPARPENLPEPGPELFAISSELPETMIRNALTAHVELEPKARGFVFNADLAMLVKFLEIGTKFEVSHG